VELREAAQRGAAVDLSDAAQTKAFVGKHRGVLQHQKGTAVSQLASQEPDDSVVFRAWKAEGLGEARMLAWRNKPQARDPCVSSLVHSSAVSSAAVSRTRIVGGAGKVVAVYNRETEELLEESAGSSDVYSVAIWENESGQGLIVAGFDDGTIKAWDAGTLAHHIPHSAQS
jgi:WD40 repeat protein